MQEPFGTPIGWESTSPRKVLIIYTEHAESHKSLLLTFSNFDSITNGDTITIGSNTYTFVDAFTSPPSANEILIIPGSKHLLYTFFGYAINGIQTYSGTQICSSNTVKHPDVRAFITAWQTVLIASEAPGTEYAYSNSGMDDVLMPLSGEGTWVGRDTAQYAYDHNMKCLGQTVDEWVANGYENYDGSSIYPSLPVLAKLLFGERHPMEVIHIGLDPDTGIITPWVAEETYGYYRSDKPKYAFSPINSSGWDGTNMYAANNRMGPFIDRIIADPTFAAYLDSSLQYDNNISGSFDFVIFHTPEAYAAGTYYYDLRDYATLKFLSAPITVGDRELIRMPFQLGGLEEVYTHMHEYIHLCYEYISAIKRLETPWVMPLHRNYTHQNSACMVEIADFVSGFVPDTYVEAPFLPSPPWGTNPCAGISHFASTMRPGVMHPLIAASLGLADLLRVVSASGEYQIQNMVEKWDVIAIQSPYNPAQVVFLNVFYPLSIEGETEYGGSGSNWKGVYAHVWLRDDGGYSNYSGKVRTYTVDTMTEYWQYGNIGSQAFRSKATTPDVDELNKKLVLLDINDIEHCRLSYDGEPFGVTVEFVEWTFPDGIPTATVNITIDELPAQPVLPAPSINDEEMTDTTALVEWEGIEGTLCDIECDTTDDFSGVYPGRRCSYGLSLGSHTITGLTMGTTYYLRMRRTDGMFWTAWSEPISFTTLEYFWHIDNVPNGALVGEVEVPSGIKKIDVTLTWDGHDPIVIAHNCTPDAVQTIVIPAIYPGERVVMNYSHLVGTSTGYVDVPEISVKEAAVSQQIKLGGNEVVTIKSADGLAMCYLCHYNGGVYALVVKDGVGVAYDNLTEANGFDPLTTESAYKPFLCPDGTPFGAHISISRVLPTTSQPAVMCKICLRRT